MCSESPLCHYFQYFAVPDVFPNFSPSDSGVRRADTADSAESADTAESADSPIEGPGLELWLMHRNPSLCGPMSCVQSQSCMNLAAFFRRVVRHSDIYIAIYFAWQPHVFAVEDRESVSRRELKQWPPVFQHSLQWRFHSSYACVPALARLVHL